MSVNPGFGGQSFIENTYAKVKKLKELITIKGASTIKVDGGVTNKNAKQLVKPEPMCLLLELYIQS
jgi:ribulose-phosphate 3-epimerase